MKTIIVTSALTTGLDPAFAGVRTIEIEDTPLGQGGFGVTYRARSINGAAPTSQVVKLLLGPSPAAVKRGYSTTQELQRRLAVHDGRLRGAGASLVQSHPALAGAPQLSFEGTLDGQQVVGYTATDLTTLGMEDFGDVLADDRKVDRLQRLPLAARMSLAWQLVDAFEFLSTQASYIHADIKAEAIFVDLARARCAVIDFDSGAVARDAGDTPTTFGTRQDWLAPEIIEQLDRPGNAARVIQVNLLSDVWSVNVAVHYLLFGISPLFFFTEASERSIKAYAQRFRWPDADATFPYFRREYAAQHASYTDHLRRALPHDLVDRLAFTMNEGYANPAARTSYGQWKSVLGARNKAAIGRFTADRTFVTDTRPVRLEWSVSGALRLEIAGVGDVTGRSGVDVPVRGDTTFTLTLVPLNGRPISRSIRVEVSKAPPSIHLFHGNLTRLTGAMPARLEWQVSGAERLAIDQGVGDVSGRSLVEVLPRRDTVYTLTATSPFGVSAHAQWEFLVPRTRPRIARLTASKRFVRAGDEFVLEWNVSGASEVAISPGLGAVPPAGRTRVRAGGTTRFTLTAASYFGAVASAAVVVTVVARTVLVPAAQRTKLVTPTPLAGSRSRLQRTGMPIARAGGCDP
jgi:serine/threonine protein kinase